MANVNKDRETLKRLVESYGKQDVLKFVNHINEMGYFNKSTRLPRPGVLVVVDISGSMYEILQKSNIDFVNTFRINPNATANITFFANDILSDNERIPVTQLSAKIKEKLPDAAKNCGPAMSNYNKMFNNLVDFDIKSGKYETVIIITDYDIVDYDEKYDITWAVEAIEDTTRLIIYDAENSQFLTDDIEDDIEM